MQYASRTGEQAIRLLWYLAGVVSTIVGSWTASKIHVYHDNRKLHHDDLKQKVLTPIRDCLQTVYSKLVRHLSPVVTEDWGKVSLRRGSTVTDQQEILGPFLKVGDPRSAIEASLDQALLEDGAQNHYGPLLAEWRRFSNSWSQHARRCEAWVSEIAAQILEKSGLPPHLAPAGQPYVMHLRLACYVYMRLLELPARALRKEHPEQSWWRLVDDATLAAGSEARIDKLIQLLNEIVETERGTTLKIRQEASDLNGELGSLIRKFSLAVAERRLRGRCRLARFL